MYLVFAVATATAAASVARSTLGTIGITLGVLLALPVLGLAGPLSGYLPALAIAAASTVLLLAAATSRFGHREV